jgi:acetyl esterase/lipase
MEQRLDPLNDAFAQAISDMPAPHDLGAEGAFTALEELQKHDPASDIERRTVKIPGEDGSSTDVEIFTSNMSKTPCHMVFYTHGGGWVMGR